MNLTNLIKESQRLAGRVDADYNDRTRRWLNEAQNQWAIAVPWPSLVRTEDFVATGERQLILPPRVLTVQWVADKTNAVPLDVSQHFDREFPSSLFQGTSGAAMFWREQGAVPVLRQPATGAGRLVVQTTASDSFGCYIGGLVQDTAASGTAEQYRSITEKVDVSSDSPFTAANTYIRVEVLGKDDFTNADVSVKDASGNLLARIPAHAYVSEYKQIEFVHIPIAGTIMAVSYLQRPDALIENYQTPHPAVDPDYLIWYAASMIHSGQGQEDHANIKMARAKEILERRIYKERLHGDKDIRALPEPGYHNYEDQYVVPEDF